MRAEAEGAKLRALVLNLFNALHRPSAQQVKSVDLMAHADQPDEAGEGSVSDVMAELMGKR